MSHAPDFNPLAGPYRWMERLTFGPFLARCRFAFLDQAKSCRQALVLGDGDGRFTARLLRANPHIHIHAIDASSAMLKALTRRAGPHAARLRTHQADARDWDPAIISGAPGLDSEIRKTRKANPGKSLGAPEPVLSLSRDPSHLGTGDSPIDLIATHFFLDCLTTEEIHSLATRLSPTLSPNAFWIVSEFAIPPGWYGRLVARPLIAALYRAFALLTGLTVRTLPDHPAALRAAGFTLIERRPRLAGLLVSELWSKSPPGRPEPAQTGHSLLRNCYSRVKIRPSGANRPAATPPDTPL